MGTLIDKLNHLKQTKEAIKAALISRGFAIDDEAPFSDYAEVIENGENKDTEFIDAVIQKKVTEIHLSRSLSEIGAYMFRGNQYLTSVSVSSAMSVKEYAFANCISLSSVDLNKSYYIYGHAFENCYKLTTVDIPKVYVVMEYAFSQCRNLEALRLDANGQRIEAFAFNGCSALSELVLSGSVQWSLDEANAFSGTPIASGTGFIYVPDELVESYKTANNWATYASQIKGISELGGAV